MGVITTYDEIKYELKNKLADCIRLALRLQDENVWGYSDMKSEYIDNMLEVLIMLQKAKRKL